MRLRLFVVHNSHPCAAVEKALQLKGLSYRVLEWPPPFQVPMQLLIFRRRTVPALMIDGRERISGSRAIMHRLDELAPRAPWLYPQDAELRRRVEEADRWGDEEFQQVVRDLLWAAAAHRPDALVTYSQGSRIPLPAPAIRASAPLIVRAERALNHTSDAQARRRLEALPAQIAKIDGWIEDGTIGAATGPNAADLQILSTVRLLASLADVRPILAGTAALRTAEALWPPVLGEMPAGALAAA